MQDSEFPIEKSIRRSSKLSRKGMQSPTVYRYVEQPPADLGAGESYDSLLDYWHILLRHRTTLLSFAVVGLLAAILISLVQTPIYRVRTSLEIQSTNDSTGSYASPESYVETQVKLLQSESSLEHVIDKLKLHSDQSTTRWGGFA